MFQIHVVKGKYNVETNCDPIILLDHSFKLWQSLKTWTNKTERVEMLLDISEHPEPEVISGNLGVIEMVGKDRARAYQWQVDGH